MFKFAIPLIVFIVLAVFLAIGLSLNPREIPSPLIDKPAPAFTAAKLHATTETLSPIDLKGRVWLLNVWASWCISCRAEHPVLNQFARQKAVYIVGLNYKDETSDAKNWLDQLGNPYDVSVIDQDGRIGIDWGVYGVPETFIIDKNGLIRYKHTGPITVDDLENKLLPLITQLQGEAA